MVDLNQFASVGGLAALIVVVLEVVKWVGNLNEQQKSWLPLIAVMFGTVAAPAIGFALQRIQTPADIASWVLGGFLAGAAAIGAYDVGIDKATGLFVRRA